MKALITGITGMVGSHLADYLLENTDWEVDGMVRWRSNQENLAHLHDYVNLKLINGDLNDSGSLIQVINRSRPDYIFHLAAQSFPRTSFDSPIETLNTNILGTCRLLEAVKNVGIDPWIHICASSEVFGKVPIENLPISETTQFHPASPYAISKVGTDLIGRFYAEAYNMNIITTRMFTHTGPRRGDVFAEGSFAKQIAMIEAGLQTPWISVGNLNSMRTYMDVRDAVRAYFMLLTVNPIAGEFYNIGGDFSCTVGDMLNHLIALSPEEKSIKIQKDFRRFRPIDANNQIPDSSKFRKHTGWKPEIPFEITMLDLLGYWRTKVWRENQYIKETVHVHDN